MKDKIRTYCKQIAEKEQNHRTTSDLLEIRNSEINKLQQEVRQSETDKEIVQEEIGKLLREELKLKEETRKLAGEK